MRIFLSYFAQLTVALTCQPFCQILIGNREIQQRLLRFFIRYHVILSASLPE